ncbi:MAG: Smr/MutS family protein [Bryobacteraceae bacterium]|nr:Smr/MutS family protein [Bryobacteraceae bacterium]
MNQTSAELLEYGALKALVGRYVSSPMGRERLEAIAPSADQASLEQELAEAGEGIEYLRAAAQPQPAQRGAAIRPRFESLPDPTKAVELLRIEGAVLEGRQIYELTELLDRASDLRAVFLDAAARYPRLSARAARIGDFRPVLKEVSGKVLPDGTLDDHASVALNRLRRDIEKQKVLIQNSLERFLRAHREDGVLQEEYVTIRNDRFVVPVVAGRQSRVEGVIHGASSTGHTLFVEPFETIHLNNDLVRLMEEEQREVYRILREITDRLRGSAAAVADTVAVLGELEIVFAKARFAQDFDCVIPRFGATLTLTRARHPLLQDVLRRQKKQVVPVSLTLDRQQRTLLISGPNTGGKTVTMKTVGLLALMAQSGLPVPAEDAEFPVFEQVLADIGDQQSIQESLSTFSAHITRVREMAFDVTPQSLVLLDELGRATDPEEGGALGVALLEHFRGAGAFTFASTHLLALKVYGANTPGVVNGSMGFDEHTLEPTYILRLGAPGKSAGLDIASRLGMPEDIIRRARLNMTRAEQDIARFLSELHQKLETITVRERELEKAREEVAARERQLEREWEKREAAKIRELERKAEAAISAFESRANETIEAITQSAEARKAADQARRKVSKARREFQEEVEAAVRPPDAAGEAAGAPARPKVTEGARVKLKGIREAARVRRVHADEIEVEAGFLRLKVPLDDVLEVMPEAGESSRLPKGVSFQPAGPSWNLSQREINVIGRRAEEAVDEIDKFLDSAAMASVDRVRIVHGHGMGILKKAVAELLGRSPHVEKFYAATPAEGGAGATIVELK